MLLKSVAKKLLNKYSNFSPIAKRVASGTFWSLTGTALAKFLILLSGIFCARILGTFEYGQLGMIRSTIAMFIVIGSAGLGLTASKYISEYRASDSKEKIASIYWLTNGFGLLVGLLVTILVLIFAPYLAKYSLHDMHLVDDIRLGAILLFLTIINAVQNGVLAGFENFKCIARNTLIAGVVESSLVIIGAYYYRVEGAIVGCGLSFFVLTYINYKSIKITFIKHKINSAFKSFDKSDLKIIVRFSFPAVLNSLMITPVFWSIRSMLVATDGFSKLGIYEAANQWKIIILFIPGAISNIILPILSNVNGKSDTDSFGKLLKYSLLINTGTAFILATIVALFSSTIMSFYGQSFKESLPLILLAYSTVFTTMALVITVVLTSKAKMWINLVFNFIWALMMLGFSYYFLQKGLGASALPLAILLSYAVHAMILLIYLFKIEKWENKEK